MPGDCRCIKGRLVQGERSCIIGIRKGRLGQVLIGAVIIGSEISESITGGFERFPDQLKAEKTALPGRGGSAAEWESQMPSVDLQKKAEKGQEAPWLHQESVELLPSGERIDISPVPIDQRGESINDCHPGVPASNPQGGSCCPPGFHFLGLGSRRICPCRFLFFRACMSY